MGRRVAAWAVPWALVLALAAAACTSPGPTLEPARTSPAPARSIDPNFDWGQRISITAHGFVPKELVAKVDRPITWVNRTSHSQRIVFSNAAGHSGPIAPGKTYSYTSKATVSIAYRSAGGRPMTGGIQVEP